MEYTIKELADLAGVTTRTLRWYDRKGLLRPAHTTQAGYRMYGGAEVDRLQQILFYRELGLALSAIRTVLDDPDFDREAALQSHLAALEDRRARLDSLILTTKKTIDSGKGDHIMSDQEKFEGFLRKAADENEAKFGREVRARYGDQAMEESSRLFQSMTPEQYARMSALDEEIRRRLASAVSAGLDPSGEEGRAIARIHREWLAFTWPKYTPDAHRGLAETYTADERFTAYYDETRPGCAAFLRDAVTAYTAGL